MKRYVSVIILTLLVFSAFSASAENFVLRNDITFGDSIDDVQRKETIPLEKIDDTFDDGDEDQDYPYTISTKKDTVAGIGGSYITYKFDKENKLREVQYFFSEYTNRKFIDSDFEKVNQGLIRKYGKPLGFSNWTTYIITGGALKGADLVYTLMQLVDGIGDMVDYDEWVVFYDGYNVKIEQVCFYWGTSYSDIHYVHSLSYTFFTDEQLKEEQGAKQEKQDAVDNDI